MTAGEEWRDAIQRKAVRQEIVDNAPEPGATLEPGHIRGGSQDRDLEIEHVLCTRAPQEHPLAAL